MDESKIYEDSDVMDFRGDPDDRNIKPQLIAYGVCAAIGVLIGIVIGMKIG